MKLIIRISFFLMLVFFISCAPVYIPNTVNAPLFSGKGEFNLGAHTGTNGIDIQTAYAFTDHLGIMINGSFMTNDTSQYGDHHKHTFGELGLGYYNKLGSVFRVETFAGFGMGRASAYDSFFFIVPQAIIADGHYSRIFVQTSIGASTDFFDGGLTLRGCYVNFYKYTYGGTDFSHKDDDFFFEPVLFARIGWKYIKFQTQFGLSVPMNDNLINYQPFMMSFGLHFNFRPDSN
jgi:hypothetical protein